MHSRRECKSMVLRTWCGDFRVMHKPMVDCLGISGGARWDCWTGGMETFRSGPERRCCLPGAHPRFAAVAEAVRVVNETVMR